MPKQWILDLEHGPDLSDTAVYNDLHRITCQFFEQADADHAASSKPFAVNLSTSDDSAAPTRMTLTWLSAQDPRHLRPPAAVHIGGRNIQVTAHDTKSITYEHLEAGPATRRAILDITSPAHFRHNHHDYPLPDPYITLSSLGRQYLLHRPDKATPDQIRDLARAAVIYNLQIRTQPFTWHDTPTAGFVGTVELGIPRPIPEPLARLFTILCRFADLAGLGHGTTHGLGAAHLTIHRANGSQHQQP